MGQAGAREGAFRLRRALLPTFNLICLAPPRGLLYRVSFVVLPFQFHFVRLTGVRSNLKSFTFLKLLAMADPQSNRPGEEEEDEEEEIDDSVCA